MPAPIQPGDVIKIPEPYYRYGIGDLVMRVEGVGPVQHLLDGAWIALSGMQIAWNGAELGERQVLVKLVGRGRGYALVDRAAGGDDPANSRPERVEPVS